MRTRLRFIALTIAVAALSACATPPPLPTLPEPIVVVEPVTGIDESQPDLVPEEPVSELSPVPPSVAVVLTSRNAVYEALADALSSLFESISVYDLSDKSQPPASAFRVINDGQNTAVVAVGLGAAQSAVAMSTQPVIFSYVFNHQDHELLQAHSRGVEAFAPLDMQLSAWKQAEPSLQSVGILIGPGHEALVAEARRVAAQHGVRVTVVEAASDQEALYLFKRAARDIDGLWLLPDNRILSARALRQMMQLANRQDVSVLAPSPNMLSIGASISASPATVDVAERIYDIAGQIQRGQIAAVPPMTPLQGIRVDTRQVNRPVTVLSHSPKPAESGR